MLYLSQSKSQDVSKNILEQIAAKTNMEDWKNNDKIMQRNQERLADLKERKAGSRFYKGLKDYVYKKKHYQMRGNIKNAEVATLYVQERKKDRKEIAKKTRKTKLQTTVSPIEIAVQCKRLDWLDEAINKWGLIGNIITNEGQHILLKALENCDIEMIKMLILKGQILQMIGVKGNKEFYDLDGVFTQAFLRVYRMLYKKRNFQKFTEAESKKIIDFQNYVLEKKSKWGFSYYSESEACYFINMTGGVEKNVEINELEEKQRIGILKESLDIYMKNIKRNIKAAPITDINMLIEDDTFLPLYGSKNFLGRMAMIPELAPLVANIISASENTKDAFIQIFPIAIEKANLDLVKILVEKFNEHFNFAISQEEYFYIFFNKIDQILEDLLICQGILQTHLHYWNILVTKSA